MKGGRKRKENEAATGSQITTSVKHQKVSKKREKKKKPAEMLLGVTI